MFTKWHMPIINNSKIRYLKYCRVEKGGNAYSVARIITAASFREVMVAAINKFLRSVSPTWLKIYFRDRFPEATDGIDWQQDRSALARQLIQSVAEWTSADRTRIAIDAGRIITMSDEGGQTALHAAALGLQASGPLFTMYDNTILYFLTAPELFRRAEAIRYIDHYRFGRIWSGFQCPKNLVPRADQTAIAGFQKAVLASFDADQAYIDIHDRTRPTLEHEPTRLFEADIYRDGKIDEEWLLDDGTLKRRIHRKVVESSITYEPATGIIETCSGDKKMRAAFVQLFAAHLLGVAKPVPIKRNRLYHLRPLLSPHKFPTDPKDGIAGVKVALLKLAPHDTAEVNLTLEVTRNATTDIWALAEQRFGAANPLTSGWLVNQARLLIHFHAHPDGRPERILPVTITMPSGCDLKDRTEDERIIGERYLRRWGLKVDRP